MAREKTHSPESRLFTCQGEGGRQGPTSTTRRDSGSLLPLGQSLFFTPPISQKSLFWFYSPSCSLESLSLSLQLPSSQSSLFLRGDIETDFSFQLQPSSAREGTGNLYHFFLCHSHAKEDRSYSSLFTLELQKTISNLILFSFPSLPSV